MRGAALPVADPSSSPRSSVSDNLNTINLEEHYETVRKLGRGTYGDVVLARCRNTGIKVALKRLPKTHTKFKDFQREFVFGYFLSPHTSIINTFDVAFETSKYFVFAQEYAAQGDLFDFITPQVGLDEVVVKKIVSQVASALEFMHTKDLVHRDIKPENVLVFDTEFNKVKLMDFGMTRKSGAFVRKLSGSIPYTPPEICATLKNEGFYVHSTADVWAFAVLLFCLLTGNFPWETACMKDAYFKEFDGWQRRKTQTIPSQWRRFTTKLMALFRRMLQIKPDRRLTIDKFNKYLSCSWIQTDHNFNGNETESEVEDDTEAIENVDNLSSILKNHGVETEVDKKKREKRVEQWLDTLNEI